MILFFPWQSARRRRNVVVTRRLLADRFNPELWNWIGLALLAKGDEFELFKDFCGSG
jgi:hypothetical protein